MVECQDTASNVQGLRQFSGWKSKILTLSAEKEKRRSEGGDVQKLIHAMNQVIVCYCAK
jgi:hypothetical protein